MRGIGYAVGRSVDSVYQPTASNPLLIRDNEPLLSTQSTANEAYILNIKMVGSKGWIKVGNIHSGSFSVQRARSPDFI
jgi:hypothetical protein